MPVRSTTGGGSGAGGKTFNTTQLDVVTITYAGAGGETFNTTQLDVVTITYNGAGGETFNTTQLDVATVTYNGAGSMTTNNVALDLAVLTYNGAGSMSVGNVALDLVVINYAGAGGMSIGNVALNLAVLNFAGAGGFTQQTTQLDVATTLFVGQGGMSGGTTGFGVIESTFNGLGGFFLNAIEQGIGPSTRPNSGKVVVCDATFGATYGAVPLPNEAFTLIVNAGQSLSRASRFNLVFVGPNNQVQTANTRFLFLGTSVILLQKEPIQPFEYLWYQVAADEFMVVGPWQVFVESDLIALDPQVFTLALQ